MPRSVLGSLAQRFFHSQRSNSRSMAVSTVELMVQLFSRACSRRRRWRSSGTFLTCRLAM